MEEEEKKSKPKVGVNVVMVNIVCFCDHKRLEGSYA
jgi:hypothetical protein